MSTAIRYLRLFMHRPASQGGGRRGIGYLSQYGDILRLSFDPDYIEDAQRPTLALSYTGENEAATRQILASMRDARLVRTDGRWPTYFQNLLPEGHNRDRLAAERGCAPDDEFELLAAAGRDLMGALEVEPVPLQQGIPDTVRHWHTTQGLDVLEPGFVEYPVEDAASLPGVVTKFSAVHNGRRYTIHRHGQAPRQSCPSTSRLSKSWPWTVLTTLQAANGCTWKSSTRCWAMHPGTNTASATPPAPCRTGPPCCACSTA